MMEIRSFFNRYTRSLAWLWACFVFSQGSSDANGRDINEQRVPRTQEDLIAIQDALVKNSAMVREATVSISIGDGFGSGVIVSPDGLILTAAHVTAAVGKDLTVILNDGTKLKALSMGLMADTDAAMMRIVEEGSYPHVSINRKDDYELGDWVFCLGHSGGFDQVRGPVLRLGRILKDTDTTLYTDCKVIGGDSGGPLFDMNGHLIAIHSRVNQGVVSNLHVPMREYIANWEALEDSKFLGEGAFAQRPVKGSGFLGIGSSDSDDGLRVDKLLKDGAAEKAGFMVGDLIRKMNDEPIALKEEMVKALEELATGDMVSFLVSRGDEEVSLQVKLAEK